MSILTAVDECGRKLGLRRACDAGEAVQDVKADYLVSRASEFPVSAWLSAILDNVHRNHHVLSVTKFTK